MISQLRGVLRCCASHPRHARARHPQAYNRTRHATHRTSIERVAVWVSRCASRFVGLFCILANSVFPRWGPVCLRAGRRAPAGTTPSPSSDVRNYAPRRRGSGLPMTTRCRWTGPAGRMNDEGEVRPVCPLSGGGPTPTATLHESNLMRATPVLCLCKLGLVTRTSRIRSKVDHAPLSVSLRSRACKRIPEPLVRGFPDRGKPGRRDRNSMDSHVTSNTPPRSNTGSQ